MKLALADLENAEIWVYPEAFPDASRSIAIELPEPNRLAELWRALKPSDSEPSIFQLHHLSGEKAGRRKDDDSLVHLNCQFVHDLAQIGHHERWRIAHQWCSIRLGKAGNQGELAKHKHLFAVLCDLSQQAISTNAVVAVVQDGAVE